MGKVAGALVNKAFSVLDGFPVGAIRRGGAIILARGYAIHSYVDRGGEVGHGDFVVGGDDVNTFVRSQGHLISQLRPVTEENRGKYEGRYVRFEVRSSFEMTSSHSYRNSWVPCTTETGVEDDVVVP